MTPGEWWVREGNTGILYLTGPGGAKEQVVPNCDLDETRGLLLEFQELTDERGRALKDNYWAEGYNWYPTMVSFLYWHVFYPYVRYVPLVHKILDGRVSVRFGNRATLHRLVTLLRGEEDAHPLKAWLFWKLVNLNNRRVLSKHRAEVLFFRFTGDDFRSGEIRQTLDELGVQYIEVVPPDKGPLLRNLRAVDRRYFFGGQPAPNRFRKRYAMNGLDPQKRTLFERAIANAEVTISSFVREYARHRRLLGRSGARVLYGFDDCNGYVFPVLYAAQQNGIRTVGHQHGGGYVRRHAGYVMEGIEREAYRWFDKVIVWGQYWKDHALKISRVYSPDLFVVGCNRMSYDYRDSAPAKRKPRNVLVPYEFAANTNKVGKYITAFVELGYNVFFKVRPDEALGAQIEAYGLPEHVARRLVVVDEINSALMERIDIVAGTMTVLLYELLPYHKIVWVLDTEYRHLEDLVEDGLAHKVRYEDLARLDERYFVRTEVDASYFFNPAPLREVVAREVLQRTA